MNKLYKLLGSVFLLCVCCLDVAWGLSCSDFLVCPPDYEPRAGSRFPICKCEKIEALSIKVSVDRNS